MALVTYLQGRGLVAGFVIIAGVLLGAALLLPLVFAGLLRAGERSADNALAQWFWADSRQQLSGLSLALMALLLALSANVGVGTMVEGFRKTFTTWLDERLNSEIYFDAPSDADAARIVEWLKTRPEVTAILPVWRAETRIDAWPVDVFGIRDHATYREHFSLLSQANGAWDLVARGEGVLVSEQLARRLGVDLGAAISIPTARGLWRTEAVGIYPDYGNPKGQLRVNVDALVAHWPPGAAGDLQLACRARARSAASGGDAGADLVRFSAASSIRPRSRPCPLASSKRRLPSQRRSTP